MIDVAGLILRNTNKFEKNEGVQPSFKGDDKPQFSELLNKAIDNEQKNSETAVQPDDNKFRTSIPPEASRADDNSLQTDDRAEKIDSDNNPPQKKKPLSEDEKTKIMSLLQNISAGDIKIQGADNNPAEKKSEKINHQAAASLSPLNAQKKESLHVNHVNAESVKNAEMSAAPANDKNKNKIFGELNPLIESVIKLLAPQVDVSKNTKNGKAAQPEFSENMKNMKSKPSKGPFEILSQKLSELREIVNKKSDSSVKNEPVMDGRMDALTKKIAAALKRVEQARVQPQSENGTAAVKEIAAKLAEIIEALKPSNEERRSDKSADRDGGITFNFFKNDGGLSARRVSGAQTPADLSRFRDQYSAVVDHAKIAVRDGKNATFVMKMYPKELGGVGVSLGLEQGVINGRFLVDSEEAKNLLTANLADLKEKLESEGVKVGSFEVDVSGRGKESFVEREDDGRVLITAREGADAAADYDNMGILQGDGNLREGSINFII